MTGSFDAVRKNEIVEEGTDLFNEFNDLFIGSHAGVHSAATSFYIFLTIVPLLILACFCLRFVDVDLYKAVWWIAAIIPDSMGSLLDQVIESIGALQSTTLYVILFVIIAIWSASKLFCELIYGLEEIYGRRTPQPYVPRRARSIVYTVFAVLAMFLYFVAFSVLSWLEGQLTTVFVDSAKLIERISDISFIFTLLLLMFLFMCIYRWVPSNYMRFWSQLPGAIIAAIAWFVTSKLFVIYAAKISIFPAFGLVGGFVLAMLWVFICSWFFFFGAALNQFLGTVVSARRVARREKKDAHEQDRLALEELAESRDFLDADTLDAGSAAVTREMLDHCELCPRRCRADRAAGDAGMCGADGTLKVARAALHFWEEPPISGFHGSGTVFFSYCSLGCVYCQNANISHEGFGKAIDVDRLTQIFLELQEQGANNINLVTPTHYLPFIIEALDRARAQGLALPIVYNTSGYERPETLRLLRGYVDVYLTDFKYMSSDLAARYSHAADYPTMAAEALAEMFSQVGTYTLEGYDEPDADDEPDEPVALLKRGVIVRHLMLPGCLEDSKAVVRHVYGTYGDAVCLSLMNQYTPLDSLPADYPELATPVSDDEYDALIDYALELGVTNSFMQEGGAAEESFIPPFDTTGV